MEILKKLLSKINLLRKRTKIILGIVLVVVLIIAGFALKKTESPYELGKIMRGDVIEEVSATGAVESAEEVDLRFNSNGIIESINVKIGDKVKKGTYLARLASGGVYSQYLQAQASYNQAKAKLDQLLAGASNEEIKVAEQVLENARIALDDARAKADNDLNQDYNSALVYLVGASNKCNKAITDLSDIERSYFSDSSAITKIFKGKKEQAEEAFLGISTLSIKGAQELIETAVNNPTHTNIDLALSKMWTALQKTSDALEYTKTAMSDTTLRNIVSSTDKTTVNNDAADINSVFISINDSQTNIANQKIANQVNINSAESTYNKAKADLEKLKAVPRAVDIAVYQAEVDRYSANMNEYAQKLKDASILAPFDGTVAKIDGKIGEIVSAGGKTIISLIAPGGFQIRAEISEADIRKVDLDDPAEITLDAFPGEKWSGQVIEIEPAETIVEGVVYYRIKILFQGISEKSRSGMTADITIQTDRKENALYVPYRSIIFKNNKTHIRILENKEIKEIEVETGLKGNNGEIEIISELNEGDEIIVFMKK